LTVVVTALPVFHPVQTFSMLINSVAECCCRQALYCTSWSEEQEHTGEVQSDVLHCWSW